MKMLFTVIDVNEFKITDERAMKKLTIHIVPSVDVFTTMCFKKINQSLLFLEVAIDDPIINHQRPWNGSYTLIFWYTDFILSIQYSIFSTVFGTNVINVFHSNFITSQIQTEKFTLCTRHLERDKKNLKKRWYNSIEIWEHEFDEMVKMDNNIEK